MTETKEKAILIEIDNVRIKEYDSLNVVVERLEEVFNPIKKETVTKWRFKGYSKTIHSALKFIARNELLVNKGAVKDLKSYLDQIKVSNEALMEVAKL